jgi:geranylgeranyl diphosphate synthase type I
VTVQTATRHHDGPATGQLRERLDRALAEFIDRQHHLWPVGARHEMVDAIRGFVLDGGKRLRPVFCYWGWRGGGGPDGDGIITAAAALELFHAFALIHDDIIDGSDRRRGKPSVHRQFAAQHTGAGWRGDPGAFGRDTALLCGDLCAAWAEQMFHECGLTPARIHRAYRMLARMRTEVIAGQHLDLVSGLGDSPVTTALRVIRLKAARYTVTRPLQIGAALAGAPPKLFVAYQAFGDSVGDAFQLRDDVLGVFGDPELTGKSNVDDLREGKRTVMMALAYEAADRSQKPRLDALFGNPALDRAGADELRTLIVETGALRQTEHMIKVRADAAMAVLAQARIPESARRALIDLTAAAVDRHR